MLHVVSSNIELQDSTYNDMVWCDDLRKSILRWPYTAIECFHEDNMWICWDLLKSLIWKWREILHTYVSTLCGDIIKQDDLAGDHAWCYESKEHSAVSNKIYDIHWYKAIKLFLIHTLFAKETLYHKSLKYLITLHHKSRKYTYFFAS